MAFDIERRGAATTACALTFCLGLLFESQEASAVTCPTNGTWSADIPVKVTVRDHPNTPGTDSKSNQVRVEFSEPVEARSLVASGVLGSLGKSEAKCLFLAGECVAGTGSDGPILRELVFQLSGPVPKAATIQVVLPPSLKGSPRTIDEGKQVAGTAWTAVAGGGMKFSTDTTGKWSTCQQGAAECWSFER